MFRCLVSTVIIISNDVALASVATAGENHLFPLRISQSKRYFEDMNGKPFLVHGDTAWSLIVQLDLKETEYYLAQRKAQGFNTILVNLIEKKFSKNPPLNAEGEGPFTKPDDISTPNEAYFAHADAVIKMAARKNILVYVTPAYLGWKGGDEGWFRILKKCGPEKLRQYGRFVGARYKDYPNIMWVVGGDYTPSWFERWTVDELAEGIREGGANQLMTAHCGAESSSRPFGKRRWLDFNTVYSYATDLHAYTLREYQRKPVKPFVMIESIYEGEHKAPPLQIRKQAYWALLTGAAGHFYGNNPIWNFNSPVKVFKTDVSWKSALASRGAKDMEHLLRFFQNEKWFELVPDAAYSNLLNGSGKKGIEQISTAAVSGDDTLRIVYVSSIGKMKAKNLCDSVSSYSQAFWYDPTSGERISIIDPGLNCGHQQQGLKDPGKNKAGDGDWLLVLNGKK